MYLVIIMILNFWSQKNYNDKICWAVMTRSIKISEILSIIAVSAPSPSIIHILFPAGEVSAGQLRVL